MLVVYIGILAFGMNEFRKTPVGFIPQLDADILLSSRSFRAAQRSRAQTR